MLRWLVALGLVLPAVASAQDRAPGQQQVRVVAPRAARTGPSQGQARDEDLHWRVPLGQKADMIQQNIFKRHWIEGTYPSQVLVPANGGPVDLTTSGSSNIAHTISWTGSYIMGIAFRYGWAKEHGTPADVETALNMGGEMVNGLYILSHVSGKPGFIARGVAWGWGPSYEERANYEKSDSWFQGAPPYEYYRFRANPSHHNNDQVTRGLAFWYYFLNKYNPNPTGRVKAQMDSVRVALGDILNFNYKSHDLVVMDFDGTVSTSLLMQGGGGTGRPSTTSLMVTNALTYGYWITKDPWYKQKLDQLVREYNYLAPDAAQSVRSGADDTEHAIGGIWLASQIETNQQLKDFYRACGASLFERYRYARRPLFNYIYASMTGDVAGADMPGALETLRLYPTNTLMYPILNSIRSDVQFVEYQGTRYTAEALPFNEIPMDNEYDWKGEPQNVDGWTSRRITSLAVSGESPMVWFLADGSNTLYQTTDGGRSFSVNDYRHDGVIRDITFAGNKTRIALMATSDGIWRTTSGGSGSDWVHVRVGDLPVDAPAQRVMVDRANPNIVWAVMDDGVYRSVDLGRNEIGKLWEKVSAAVPADWSMTYNITTGAQPAFYGVAQGQMYRAGVGTGWTKVPAEGYLRYAGPGQLAIMPDRPDTILTMLTLPYGGGMSMVLRSNDGGRTVIGAATGLRGLLAAIQSSGIGQAALTSITIDPANPQNVYAASPKGVFRSTDGGVTWRLANNGLRIPYAYQVFAPREAPGKLFVSTPAGLHTSTDGGQTWTNAILVLNGPGVDHLDRGGMGYLVGYWPGRYFGYVTDAQVNEAPAAWR